MSPISIAFPGYVPDVHSTDALDPAWGNAIRDRANQVFDTSTNRDAAITVPQVGQTCVLTTLSTAGEYCYVGAVDGWRPNWNQGWGEVARTVDVSTQAVVADAAEHTITAAATTFTAVANRLYRIRLEGSLTQTAATSVTLTLRVKDNTTLIEQSRSLFPVGAGTFPFAFAVETTLTAGSHTINTTMQNSNAAGVSCPGATTPLTVVIDDIGPSGAPS